MTVKKISKILTFILVLAMVLGTVAMAADGDCTITAGSFDNGTITVKYTDDKGQEQQPPLKAGETVTVKSGTKVTVSFNPNPGYEFVSATDGAGNAIKDDASLTITDNITITPVFREKQSLGGEKTVDSFRLDAICNGYSNWQAYHKDTTNNKKYTKYPGSPKDNVTPSSEITKGNYVDLTLYVTDNDFLSLTQKEGYDANKFSVTTPGDSSFLAGGSGYYGSGLKSEANISIWNVNNTPKGMLIELTGVYYVGGNDNTLKLIVTQGNYNAILSCKIDNATILP